MPPKRKAAAAPKRKARATRVVVVPMNGAGFFDDLKSAASKVNRWARDNKVISGVAGGLASSGLLGPKGSAIAGTVGDVAGAVGYGRGRIGAVRM